MLTAAVQSSGFHKPVYYRHPKHLWTRHHCHRRSLSSRICHCAAVPRHTSRIAGHRRWTSNTSSVKHRSTAPPSSSTAICLPECLDHTFQPLYVFKCSGPSMICRILAQKQQRNSSHSVLCGPAYKKIAAPVRGLASAPKSPATQLHL
jgi:hypothetical protein